MSFQSNNISDIDYKTPNPDNVYSYTHIFRLERTYQIVERDLVDEMMRQLRICHSRSLKSFNCPSPNRGSLDPHKWVRWVASTLRHLERMGRVESVVSYLRPLNPEYDCGSQGWVFVVKFVDD